MAEGFDFETVHVRGPSTKNVIRIAIVIVGLLVLFWLSPFGTIAAGERGVHLRFMERCLERDCIFGFH